MDTIKLHSHSAREGICLGLPTMAAEKYGLFSLIIKYILKYTIVIVK